MAKVTILRGVPGCGKSTWAHAQAGKPAIVSRDDLRVAIWGSCDQDYYKDASLKAKEAVITDAQNSAVEAALRNGRDVIIDNTNIEWRFVKDFAKIAAKHGATVDVKVFDVPLATALKQNLHRTRTVPEEVIRKMHSAFQSNKHMVLEPEVGPVAYNGTPGKPKAFMYDLDGTVFHMNDKRGPYDINVLVDDVDETIADIIVYLADGFIPIAMSGRKTVTRVDTIEALNLHGIPFDHLFMRADGDDRKDSIIKAELFDMFVRDHFDVQFVLDDRRQVVEMWRAMGIKCLQVQEGDF